MVSFISDRARNYVRSRITEVMEYECRVERVTQGQHDEETLKYTPGAETVLYEGKFRLWEVAGANAVALGDADLDIQSTQASFPWDTPLFKKNDEIVITAAPNQDSAVQGKRYQIQSSAKAGELRPTRRYVVSAVM